MLTTVCQRVRHSCQVCRCYVLHVDLAAKPVDQPSTLLNCLHRQHCRQRARAKRDPVNLFIPPSSTPFFFSAGWGPGNQSGCCPREEYLAKTVDNVPTKKRRKKGLHCPWTRVLVYYFSLFISKSYGLV